MPFKSKAQMKACFAQKSRGEAEGWNCKKWADKTRNIKGLPEHVKQSALIPYFSKIAKRLLLKR